MDALTNYGLLAFNVPDSRLGFVLKPIAEAEGGLTIAVPTKVELPQVKGVRPVGKNAKAVYVYVPLKRKRKAKRAAAVEAPPPEITSAVFAEEAKRAGGAKRRRKKAVEA